MSNPLKLCHNFIHKNPAKLQTIHIVLVSAWYRFLIKFIPMKRLEKSFGAQGEESTLDTSIEDMRKAYLIGIRVERILCNTPWDSKCLVKALTARRLIHKKHIETTLFLGVALDNSNMVAHAWLRCGKLYVTGGRGDGYSIVATFRQ